MAAELEDLMTVREAAQQCHRTPETIRRWVWEGKLPAQKLGNQLFVKRTDIARITASDRERDKTAKLAILDEIRTLRESIRQDIGGNLDVLDLLDRSREAHP
jgi:excisionase family DNA binding protein